MPSQSCSVGRLIFRSSRRPSRFSVDLRVHARHVLSCLSFTKQEPCQLFKRSKFQHVKNLKRKRHVTIVKFSDTRVLKFKVNGQPAIRLSRYMNTDWKRATIGISDRASLNRHRNIWPQTPYPITNGVCH